MAAIHRLAVVLFCYGSLLLRLVADAYAQAAHSTSLVSEQ